MTKAKAKTGQVVEFDVAVKNRKPFRVAADSWNLGSGYDHQPLKFFLRGELVLSVPAQKWDFVERVTPIPDSEP